MVLIIAGTDRAQSNTSKVAAHVLTLFQKNGMDAEILDLAELKPTSHGGPHYGIAAPDLMHDAIEKVSKADALYIVVPEYNGSMPGALKYFIDHWKYPETFEFRPVALCGLGWAFGGLRPVEHLQGVLGYRNAFIYPERIFMRDAPKIIKEHDGVKDPFFVPLFEKQVTGFTAFIKALQAAKLDANSRLAGKA